MERAKDWERRLGAYLFNKRGVPFRWGENDCGHFAAGAIAAMTDVDLGAEFGGYTDESGAQELVAKAGEGTLLDLVERICAANGIEEWEGRWYARRGDLVLVEFSGRQTFGVVGLDGQIVVAGERGMQRLPIRAARRAWKI